MTKKDILITCALVILVCVDAFCCLDFVDREQKFQKTIDVQKEMLYNKDMQIEKMKKVISVQEKNLEELSTELETYKERQSRLVDIRVTHYSADETGSSMTASGREAIVGRTVACNFLPIGTHVIINGHEYVVEDTGGMVGNVVDIFVNDADEARILGTYHTVMEVI